jgi:hypothetical protein
LGVEGDEHVAGEMEPMSFRREGKKANSWRKRSEKHTDLLQRAGLPDVVLTDDRAFAFFLQEGCFQGARGTPLTDALSFLSEDQQNALHQLLANVLTEREKGGLTLWSVLDAKFRKG